MEVDKDDPTIATRVVVQGAGEGYETLEQRFLKGKIDGVKGLFRAILRAMKSIRAKVAPIYFMHPKYVLYHEESQTCKIMFSQKIFDKSALKVPQDYNFEQIKYISPEEMQNNQEGTERSEITALWQIGLMMYQAQFGKHPFATHLYAKCVWHMIRKFPIAFPPDPTGEFEDL